MPLLSCNRRQSPAALGSSQRWCMCCGKPAAVQRPQRVPVPAATGRGSCRLRTHIRQQSRQAQAGLCGRPQSAPGAQRNRTSSLGLWLQAILPRAAVSTFSQIAGETGRVVSPRWTVRQVISTLTWSPATPVRGSPRFGSQSRPDVPLPCCSQLPLLLSPHCWPAAWVVEQQREML